ncbi:MULTISPECIES: hypothetical protein [unclassified Pseudonocardia]|nr:MULTISPECIES: hypothetical protein [unclassified Pseudonocardia]
MEAAPEPARRAGPADRDTMLDVLTATFADDPVVAHFIPAT